MLSNSPIHFFLPLVLLRVSFNSRYVAPAPPPPRLEHLPRASKRAYRFPGNVPVEPDPAAVR